jgi:hypothetical protein
MVFIRYFEGAMAYQMLDPGTGCVHVSRDTIFDEIEDGSGTQRQAMETLRCNGNSLCGITPRRC